MTKKISRKRLPIMLMALVFAATSAMATDITGVTGVDGVFNIDPTGSVNNIGYRSYDNFNVSQGDTANLKFDSGINSFVNMVQNQININGLLQTVKGGAFHNGDAIFVSPNGMVVGGSGVLNVGALSVYTPTPQGMKMLENGFKNGSLDTTYQGKQINLMEAIGWHGNAPVTIDGQVYSHGDVNIVANKFNLGGDIAAGVDDRAANLFDALVKTNKSSNINIRTYERNGNGGITISGNLFNAGNGDTIIQNRGSQGFTVNDSAKITNSNGELYLVNSKGNMNIAGTVNNDGNYAHITTGANSGALNLTGNINSAEGLKILTQSASGANIGGKIVNSDKGIAITNKAGILNINSDITNQNQAMNISNTSTANKLVISKDINASGKVQISNAGAGGMEINANITNSKNTAITNHNGAMIVNGKIENTSGKMNLTQKGNGGLHLTKDSTIKSSGEEVLIQNVGNGGFIADGGIDTSAPTYLQNTKGAMNVNGIITAKDNVLYMGNTGDGGLTIGNDAIISNNNKVQVMNQGAAGMNINGIIANNGGGTAVANYKGNLTVNGNIAGKNGNINLTNKGNGALVIADSGQVGTEKGQLLVQNSGAQGLTVNGTIDNKGYALLYNKAGDLNVNGDVTVRGARLSVHNTGNGALNVNDTATLINEGLGRTYLTNTGNGGMKVDAPVVGGGHVLLTNRAGGMNVSSNVTSTKNNVVLTNTGDKNMVVDGTVRGNKVTAYAKGNDIVLGNTETEQIAINGLKKVTITNDDGSILNAGVDKHIIKSGGNLYMAATNGSIGEDVNGSNGVGADARDLTKSVNVYVNGRVKAFTTDKNKNSVINIASKGKDLRVDRIKADGKVLLLTDKAVDKDGNVKTGSILNAATELKDYANVKGTSVSMISSGSIGTEKDPIHFRQTDATKQSNILAAKDVNLHARGEAAGENVNFNVIKSKEGSINANLIRDGVVENAVAPSNINITSRKEGANLNIKSRSNNPNIIKDYLDAE